MHLGSPKLPIKKPIAFLGDKETIGFRHFEAIYPIQNHYYAINANWCSCSKINWLTADT